MRTHSTHGLNTRRQTEIPDRSGEGVVAFKLHGGEGYLISLLGEGEGEGEGEEHKRPDMNHVVETDNGMIERDNKKR